MERDVKKASYYFELAAMGGIVPARYNLGDNEEEAGNMNRALKHYMIAAGAGDSEALRQSQRVIYSNGHARREMH